MDYRLGKCSACGAEFKVPSSFAHDVARCKVCSGVVRLGPPGGKAPSGSPAVPAKRVVKREAPVETPDAEQKRRERGTLERLKAERAAAAAPEAAEPAAPGASAKPSAPAAAKPKPAGASAGRARGSSRRSRGGEEAGERRSRRSPAKEKRKMPVGGLLAVLVLVGAGAAWYFLAGSDEAPQEAAAAEPTPEAALEPGKGNAPISEKDGYAMIGDGTEGSKESAAEAEENAPETKPAPKVEEPIDMSTFEDFGPARGTTDDEWQEMNELMALYLDIDEGAKGTRAGRKLEELGRKAFPVILNHMKTLDFSTEAGYRAGFSCQKSLETILNGNNFGWKNQDEEGYVEFDKKVVRSFGGVWKQVMVDIEAWIRAAKLETKDPDEAKRLRELYGSGETDEDVADSPLDDVEDDLIVD